MIKKKFPILLFFILLFSADNCFAQQKFTISGTLNDSASGEVLIGANVAIKELSLSTVTNAFGFFSLTAPEGKYVVSIGYVGYTTQNISVNLNKNTKLNVEVPPQSFTLKSVEVTGEHQDQNVTSTQMSTVKMDVKEIKTLPVLFGEVDILKSITLLPGVQSVGEGNGGIFVRGGAADQNLMLLDGANVYNSYHLMGFFSVFNADAIKDITIIKGGIPAEYGGRLSSVIDIHMNDGNSKKLSVTGGIGLISSRLTIEAPIVKDKGSFIISARRTYADLFIRAFGPSQVRKAQLYFYDFNAKANYRLSDKDRLYLSGYFGRDVLGISRFGINWGNATGTLRWNHIFNEKLFLNTSLIKSNYSYAINVNSGSNSFGISSSIHDYNLKTDFEYYINDKNKLKFGTSSIDHTFNPGDVSTNGKSILNNLTLEKKYALENALYISNEQTLTKKLSVVYGLRYSFFDMIGPGKFYKYDSTGAISDSMMYAKNKIVQQYGGLEPRASMRFQIDSVSSIKASYTRTSQYVQLLSNTSSSNPTDLWIPCSNNILPQLGDQYALGYFRNFKNNTYEASAEVYYKNMQNQVDYKPGADLVLNPLVESQLYTNGKGRAYGAEFFVKKNAGKL
ncbi:MAG TPA: TonB-dependent receptor, partial [Bacteroidia bacterium]